MFYHFRAITYKYFLSLLKPTAEVIRICYYEAREQKFTFLPRE